MDPGGWSVAKAGEGQTLEAGVWPRLHSYLEMKRQLLGYPLEARVGFHFGRQTEITHI